MCLRVNTFVYVSGEEGDGRIPSQHCGNNFTLLTWSPRKLQQVKNTIAQPRGNGNAIYILYYIKNIERKDGKRITCFATPYLVSGFFLHLFRRSVLCRHRREFDENFAWRRPTITIAKVNCVDRWPGRGKEIIEDKK